MITCASAERSPNQIKCEATELTGELRSPARAVLAGRACSARRSMSRGNALCHTLQAAPGEFDTRSVPATGDCFFDALDLQLPAEGRADELVSAGKMRDAVADSLNEEILCATTR